ncbi:hypothetical protein [Actinopolymorpha alba]|uniref:hypothetical protein n=1 Tax=Actinopolymorpha alba TaxID=533267 RepID=UPI00037BDB88|nr:hypothetical protein [Actinopolymorpha alba]
MRSRHADDGRFGCPDLDPVLVPPPDPAASVSEDTITDLLIRTREESLGRKSLRRLQGRKRWTVPLVAASAVALVGAGTTAAHQLNIAPFQTLEPGLERTTTAIPVDYVNYRDRMVHCQAFIEFSGVTSTQRGQINVLVADTDWTGYGQRLIDSVPASDRTNVDDEAAALGDALTADLTSRTLEAVPGLTAANQPGVPRVTGGSWSCRGPGGQDGAP